MACVSRQLIFSVPNYFSLQRALFHKTSWNHFNNSLNISVNKNLLKTSESCTRQLSYCPLNQNKPHSSNPFLLHPVSCSSTNALFTKDSKQFSVLGCSLSHYSHLSRPWKSKHKDYSREPMSTDFSSRGFSISAQSIVNSSPSVIQPYLRLIRADKPIGTWLLFWPCTWSISLAGQGGQLPDFSLIALFGLGAFLMRGAGCIINDMWDKDYDRQVERTKQRPLASGELTSFQALCFLGLNLSMALGVLLHLNWYSVMLGAASMLLVVTYPLMKRYTYWPQAFLGLTLNWGVLLGWSQLHGALEWPVISLFLASVVYTMTYDSIYSHQDKYDDMLIGVKSTALKFGDQTKHWLRGFSVVMVTGLTGTGVMCDQTWPYYLSVLITGAHLTHQIHTVDLDNADDCAAKFRSNSWLGCILFLGAAFGTWLKQPGETTDETGTPRGDN